MAAEESTQPLEVSEFTDQFQFIDHIHGQIQMNRLERDAIDSPEFQRLFRIAQLGLVDITYQTGNHTRGAHSIGTCHAAQKLLAALKQNRERRPPSGTPEVSLSEQILIRLGALLHDIPHGPFSHDIEKKKHLIKPFGLNRKIKSEHGAFDKHDDYTENAAFYIAVFDTEQSVLARVLAFYSKSFLNQLQAEKAPHLAPFLGLLSKWAEIEAHVVESQILPQLLFHLFAFEDMPDALAGYTIDLATQFGAEPTSWHLGPLSDPGLAAKLHNAWYQPFRHEVIGNTLSADLIDYLARDGEMLYIKGGIDENLLRHYVLTKTPTDPPHFRCAIDLQDHKRGVIRTDRLNDIFQMLELRHQIHEKAVYHRMAQSALAMLSRAVKLGQAYERNSIANLQLQITNTQEAERRAEELTSGSLYGFASKTGVAVRGDEHFIGRLINHENRPTAQLAIKLAERRLFRPLMIIPGHRIRLLIQGSFDPDERHGETADEGRVDRNFRELAAILDAPVFSPFFNVIATAIEALLRHEFTDISMRFSAASPAQGSLRELLLRFAAPDAARQLPANHRVIFWTLPFKQLFKDPAIVVAAKSAVTGEDTVLSLDQLNGYSRKDLDNDAMREFSLIHERVRSGIRDADVRYSQLWKIYVFISDGLFYGGTIAKLITDDADYASGCAEGTKRHLKHLQAARDLAASAIKEAWTTWTDKKNEFHGDNETKTSAAEQFLRKTYDDGVMERTLQRVLVSSATDAASEVNLEQYQHGEGETHSRCRDIRYRFDRHKPVPSGSLHDLLEVLGVEKGFFEAEINDLSEILDGRPELVAQVQNASKAECARLLRLAAMDHRMAGMNVYEAVAREETLRVRTPETDFVDKLALARDAFEQRDFQRAKDLARAAVQLLPSDAPQRTAAEVIIDLSDTAQQYERLIVSARKNLSGANYLAATNDLQEILRHPIINALRNFVATAHLLRADLHLEQGAYEAAGESAAEAQRLATDDRDVHAQAERIERIINWRVRKAALQTRRGDFDITPSPRQNVELESLTLDDQAQVLTLIESALPDAIQIGLADKLDTTPKTKARYRRTEQQRLVLGEQELGAILARIKKTRNA